MKVVIKFEDTCSLGVCSRGGKSQNACYSSAGDQTKLHNNRNLSMGTKFSKLPFCVEVCINLLDLELKIPACDYPKSICILVFLEIDRCCELAVAVNKENCYIKLI